jgi:predicted nucleic acid-binding protein
LVLARRGKLDDHERQAALGWLQGLPARIDADAPALAFSQLSQWADDHQLSIYDAAYLELALRRKLALACKHDALRKAAKRAAVRLWSKLIRHRQVLSSASKIVRGWPGPGAAAPS